MRTRIPRALPWFLTVVWAGVIFYGSSRPGSTLPGGWSVQAHLGEYFVLGALLTWALSGGEASVATITIAVVLASLYGASDEFHQRFVMMRTPDVTDWMLDTVGAAAGACFAWAWSRRIARLKSSAAEQDPEAL